MSLTPDGRMLICDGASCAATTRFPVALRSLLCPTEPSEASGWLCVIGRDHDLHFCLACAARYLNTISQAEVATQTNWMNAESEEVLGRH